METRKAFVRYISHELRTPLNTIFAGIKLAIQQCLSKSYNSTNSDATCSNEQKEILQEISLACGVAVEILNEFLMFDKLEQDTLALNQQEIGVIDFMASAIKMIFVQIREKKIHLTLVNYLSKDSDDLSDMFIKQIDSVSPTKLTSDHNYDDRCYIHPTDTALIDKHKLDQVMRNLLSNAIKFTPVGGNITVAIKFEPYIHATSTEVDAHLTGALVISVVDTGAGMSEADQKRLFKGVVQFRPHELQAGGGSGLGLMITKGIVDLHGGVIEVHSAGEGLGSTFTVRIPMTRTITVASPFDSDEESLVILKKSTLLSRPSYSNLFLKSDNLMSDTDSEVPLVKKIKNVRNLFHVNFIRRQSQNMLTQQFSHYEGLLAQEQNSYPLLWSSKSMGSLQQINISSKSSSSHVVALGSILKNNSECGIDTPLEWAIGYEVDGESSSDRSLNRSNRNNRKSATFSEDLVTQNQREVSAAIPLPAQISDQKKNLKVLFVDDSGMSRKMMCRMLRSEGHLVDEAEDGEKAVEALKSDPSYDAILMDSHMPNMSGPEAARVMRSLGYTGVILGITGDTAEKDLDNFLQHGASRVLVKPVDLEVITESFKELLLL